MVAMDHTATTLGGLETSQAGYTLVPTETALEATDTADYRFTIEGPDGLPVNEYTKEHDKELHLIVVRRDLSGYQHLHPTRDAEGVWSTTTDLSVPGTYRILADFTPTASGDGLTLGLDLQVPGEQRATPLPAPSRTAEIDGYTVTLTGDLVPGSSSALTPSVAIIDPELTRVLPGFLVADAGFDALTHATEAFVSVYANDYTDGLCLHAIKLIFENIERSTKAQPGSTDAADIKAREKMHNAASISGMAFGNSFLGIVHAMAHVTGATYHLVHGRTNAVYLPHVIRYNGQVPTKLTSWPKYERYIAPERFQEIAKHLGLPASTPEEGVESYARAVEELRDKVGIERSFQAQGVDETTFISGLHDLAMAAYGDQCAPANPRMPMIADMETLMEAAYYGTSFDEVRAARKGAEVASDAVTGTVTTVKAAKGARRKTNA
jgi:hypothetical protein